jgi:hypothetical protein
MKTTIIETLYEEMGRIKYADLLYREREFHSPAADSEYQVRQERLNEISSALALLA